jgi:hypothetical protein
LLLHTSFFYWAVWWHLSEAHLTICSSAFQQAFVLWDSVLEFVLGLCCQTSVLYAQPTLIF